MSMSSIARPSETALAENRALGCFSEEPPLCTLMLKKLTGCCALVWPPFPYCSSAASPIHLSQDSQRDPDPKREPLYSGDPVVFISTLCLALDYPTVLEEVVSNNLVPRFVSIHYSIIFIDTCSVPRTDNDTIMIAIIQSL